MAEKKLKEHFKHLDRRKYEQWNSLPSFEKKSWLLAMAKECAIDVLNDGKPNSQRRARMEMMTKCLLWEIVEKDSFPWLKLVGIICKDSEIDENWINEFELW